MNIDFHYGVIYLLGRLAGLEKPDAETVAHAGQYVDDSTVSGMLEFEGGESYERFASAHKMFDYMNINNTSDKRIWAPFHFLPAGEGSTLEDKSICKPDSTIAREMVAHAIDNRGAENALHRLGITLHVYIDTWAHQNFSGTISDHNVVKSLTSDDYTPETWAGKLKQFLDGVVHTAQTGFLDHVVKLGHGAALHFPDQPWAKWEYENGHGLKFKRDNLLIFMDAADMAYRAIKGFRSGNNAYTTEAGLPAGAKAALAALLESNRSDDPIERLHVLTTAFANGSVPGFSEDIPAYVAKGTGSWKDAATGIIDADADGEKKPLWSERFEQSDYRKFHDAIKEHRFVVTQLILPKHGVRLA
ncbi:DUF6765 family protein [Dyella sp. S184]|uniref:DUF6765 family protein n=1 Tax=Dyella sp. S184 TaxID=1641862 RepID=UPI00131DF369|nr:DUF6765 family protein [Dyella sp. S184]